MTLPDVFRKPGVRIRGQPRLIYQRYINVWLVQAICERQFQGRRIRFTRSLWHYWACDRILLYDLCIHLPCHDFISDWVIRTKSISLEKLNYIKPFAIKKKNVINAPNSAAICIDTYVLSLITWVVIQIDFYIDYIDSVFIGLWLTNAENLRTSMYKHPT